MLETMACRSGNSRQTLFLCRYERQGEGDFAPDPIPESLCACYCGLAKWLRHQCMCGIQPGQAFCSDTRRRGGAHHHASGENEGGDTAPLVNCVLCRSALTLPGCDTKSFVLKSPSHVVGRCCAFQAQCRTTVGSSSNQNIMTNVHPNDPSGDTRSFKRYHSTCWMSCRQTRFPDLFPLRPFRPLPSGSG